MLKLIQTEFLKLRRRRFVWLTFSAALIMPFFALLYFHYLGRTGVDPIQFYKWSAFGYTVWIILPVVLGILCAMLMREENQYEVTTQLWIVPVSKLGYFFSKFFVILIYSVCFMMINAIASIMFSVISGCVVFEWGSVLFLLEKCLEMGILTAFTLLPILAIAASQKGYILPACITLVYAFSGFFIMSVNMYLHPLSSMAVIIMRNKEIPGLVFTQEINIFFAFLCIIIWDLISILFAGMALRRKK